MQICTTFDERPKKIHILSQTTFVVQLFCWNLHAKSCVVNLNCLFCQIFSSWSHCHDFSQIKTWKGVIIWVRIGILNKWIKEKWSKIPNYFDFKVENENGRITITGDMLKIQGQIFWLVQFSQRWQVQEKCNDDHVGDAVVVWW